MGHGPEVDDARVRLLVRAGIDAAPGLVSALETLQRSDRLAGLVANSASSTIMDLARRLPTALLVESATVIAEVAGTVVAAARDVAAVTAGRQAWGAASILVADVGVSRHAAMEAGEAGADAVLFRGPDDAVLDCVAWWSELFVLPVAAPVTPETLEAQVHAGADLLLIESDWLIDGRLDPLALGARLAAAEDRGRRGAARSALGTEHHEDQR